MKIDLKKYMNDRDAIRDVNHKPGPVITLSREFGCNANNLAGLLLIKIGKLQGKNSHKKKWKIISKEIISDSAQELKLAEERVEQRILSHAMSTIDSIFSSFSANYSLSDKKIVSTVKDIIDTYAIRGSIIIIGRGGTSLTQKLKNSLHVRLIAPAEWRIKKIMKSKGLSEKDAYTLIEKIDHDRKLWAEHLSDEPFNDSLFDIIFNRKTLSDEEITEAIIKLLIDRKMI